MKLQYLQTDFPYEWKLLEPITFKHITVSEGFRTDLASIPRLFWFIYPPFGKYIRAAVIHDYLYFTKLESKKTSDLVFREIMLEDGVNPLQANLFYLAVRLFGRY